MNFSKALKHPLKAAIEHSERKHRQIPMFEQIFSAAAFSDPLVFGF
jgi:hypothetical protein